MSKKYTKKQTSFIKRLINKGLTSKEIHRKYNEIFEKKPFVQINSYVGRVRSGMQDQVVKQIKQNKEDKVRKLIINFYVKFIKEHNYVPSSAEFKRYFGNNYSINKTFGSVDDIEEVVRESNPELFSNLIDESIFDDKAYESLKKKVKKYKRFVVTTAVTGCIPNQKVLKSLKSYCEKNNAFLLILPCSDPASIKSHKYDFSLHHSLPTESIVFKDLNLNENIFLSTIKLSAKQINPLTGLKRLAQRGSCILASPKQMLEHVASSNKKQIPRALMTTGSITDPNYSTNYYMSERTAYIAEDDHKTGAIIVEIKDKETFFYRRIQINSKNGNFTDINKVYSPNGKVRKTNAHVVNQPDWHVLSTDPSFRKAAEDVVNKVKPEYMTFEDFFDGISINPHEKHNVVSRTLKQQNGLLSLKNELMACSEEIDSVSKWDAKNIVFKYGNHEDFLKRWLNTAEYSNDPNNHYEGVILAKALLEGHMPFEYAMRNLYPVKNQKKIKFLTVNDSFKLNGIENGVHGHLGSGGKRNPSMAGLEAYGPCTTGHNHSAAILREVVRVGTATYLQLSYNDGASAWTQTLNIQQKDGARQLITVINGEWCLPDILK